jgi:hypothetical protein
MCFTVGRTHLCKKRKGSATRRERRLMFWPTFLLTYCYFGLSCAGLALPPPTVRSEWACIKRHEIPSLRPKWPCSTY